MGGVSFEEGHSENSGLDTWSSADCGIAQGLRGHILPHSFIGHGELPLSGGAHLCQ